MSESLHAERGLQLRYLGFVAAQQNCVDYIGQFLLIRDASGGAIDANRLVVLLFSRQNDWKSDKDKNSG